MNLVIISTYNPYYSNSASANRLLSLVEGLKNEEVKIQFLFTNGYQTKNEIQELGKSGKYKNVNYRYLSTSLLDNIWKKRWQKYIGSKLLFLSIKYKINNYLKKFNGVVWPENDTDILKSVWYSKKANKNIKIFMELSEFPDIHNFNKGNKYQKLKSNKRQLFFENNFFQNINGLALMTKTLLNHYNIFPNPRPSFLHLPMTVDLERFNQSLPILNKFEQPYIAFVGVMDNAKDGVNILIDAFKLIHNKFPDLKLYLIGGWNYDTPSHLELIKQYQLESKIKWLGEFERNQIPSIVLNAKLLVLPRPNSKQAQGGFPTKLGEYLATGIPVCATTVGEIPDYLVNNESVFFAEPGSIDSFANAMERALSNDELSKKVGTAGKEVAKKHFNKDIQANKLNEFLKSL